MSRSRKKHPIRGLCTGDSEKLYKQYTHRCERRRVRQVIASNPLLDVIPHRYEVYLPSSSYGKEGKVWFSRERCPEWLRK